MSGQLSVGGMSNNWLGTCALMVVAFSFFSQYSASVPP
ncbi:putative membrane protein [Microcystis aeruginosa TAIHU98]|uniref:Putative membrane protein n=1 Tax=Microcystis aeruginosa TAIHU98 TaxID=1134457 RepID=L7E4S7_MICAE|nr:putative membrane protein [Microcystis aeruginosa TAIHU98]